ncbi:ABC transporter substrate-binding protein [Clostridium paraputrificum]|uniref:ABC transporter substrate-binding protein n=1 Tax=Clostridium TaxID=1485 RepID=UPI003D33C80D
MKKLKVVSLLMALALTLTGCGTSKKEAEGKIGGTITVVTDRPDATELYEKIEKDFITKYPEVEDIVWESSSDYDTYITTRMNTKDYGDVLFVPFSMNGTPSEYENYFESLGTVEELEKKYIDVTEADYNSNVYGLPAVINSLGIVYNEEVLNKAGITEMPTSTEEFIAACEKIKANTDAVPFFTNYKRTAVWGGALTSYGGEQYRSEMLKAGTAFKEGQPIREVMDLFYELASRGLIEEDPITADQAKGYQMVADGKVAMIMRGSQDVPTIQKLNTANKIKITPFPVKFEGKTSIPFGTPTVVGINKNSENKATARAFLDFFISSASGYAKDLDGMSPSKEDLNEEEKKIFEESNIVLTAPTETPETEELYNKIANEVGVARIGDVLQKVINIGLYPNQNESYEDYINKLESDWAKAVKNNE